jgi:hypothetical protein
MSVALARSITTLTSLEQARVYRVVSRGTVVKTFYVLEAGTMPVVEMCTGIHLGKGPWGIYIPVQLLGWRNDPVDVGQHRLSTERTRDFNELYWLSVHRDLSHCPLAILVPVP